MRKKLYATISVVFIIAAITGTFCACDDDFQTPALQYLTDNDPNLVFFDSFDSLNTDIWNVYTKNVYSYDNDLIEPGHGYDEILRTGIRKGGYWDKEQVFTKDGNLVIRTAIKDGKYYTGALDTDNKFERSYGYYETRVFLPKACGLWSAFWIMCDKMGISSTDAKISGSEIDIFETPFYTHTQTKVDIYQSAIHIGDYSGNDETYYTTSWLSLLSSNAKKIYDDWHVFALNWQENYYRFYLDDVLMWETDLDGNISNQDSFLFLSVEVDGIGGNAYPSFFKLLTNNISQNPENTFPVDFLVDYVKVYKSKP